MLLSPTEAKGVVVESTNTAVMRYSHGGMRELMASKDRCTPFRAGTNSSSLQATAAATQLQLHTTSSADAHAREPVEIRCKHSTRLTRKTEERAKIEKGSDSITYAH